MPVANPAALNVYEIRPRFRVFSVVAGHIFEQRHGASERDGIERYQRPRRGFMFGTGSASGFDMGNPSRVVSSNFPIRSAPNRIDKAGLPVRLWNEGLYFILAVAVHPIPIGPAVPFDRCQDRVRDSLRGFSRYRQWKCHPEDSAPGSHYSGLSEEAAP